MGKEGGKFKIGNQEAKRDIYQAGRDIIIQQPSEKEKSKNKLEKIYEVIWKKSSSLKPEKILKARPFHQYYYQRTEDNKIKTAINKGKNVLVIGHPLSGKTRAIYKALTNTSTCDVTIPICKDIDSDLFPLVLPKHRNSQRSKIIFLDDLNRFAEKQNFEHLFNKFLENNTIIVASCQSGIEYKKTQSELLSKGIDISSVFGKNIIKLPDILPEEGKKIADEVGIDWNKIEFDSTVGSIFMPLSGMKRRFREECDINEKSILRTMNLLYRCGFYKEKQIFPLEWIKIICNKKYELKGKELEWNDWLEKLNSKELIKLEGDRRIWVEEIYLERIFELDSEISDLYLFQEMIEYFSDSPNVFFDSPDVLFRFANNAYYVIGISDNKKIKLYKMAKEVCERAIENITKGSIEYAHFQKLFGITYRVLSEMIEEDRVINAEKAICACEDACNIYESKKDFLMDYAISKSDLGTAYRHCAKINKENGKKREYCEKAINACRKALKIEEYPQKYRATTLNICGATHRILADIENKAENGNQGIGYCEEALNIYTKENLPIQVAVTQNILGGLYKLLAEEVNKAENCKKAIKYFEKALKVRTLKDFEIDYAITQISLGDTYITLAEVENKAENCKNAIHAYEEALRVFTKEKFPEGHRMVQSKLEKPLTSVE